MTERIGETRPIETRLFRNCISRIFRADWLIITLIFVVHLGLVSIFRTLALLAVWVWLFVLMPRQGRQAIGLRRPTHWGWWLIGPAAGLLMVALTAWPLWRLFGWGEQNLFVDMAGAVGSSFRFLEADAPMWAAYGILGFGWLIESPLLEEPLFRGLMLTGYGRSWGILPALIIQATLFALVHPLNSFSWPVAIFAAGLVYGLIARVSKSIWPAVLAHSTYNAGIIWITVTFLPNLIFSGGSL